ncbi:hypothetical protein FRC04_007415 [Tulasnella sp. 424]|nr:hypothetical protein FRC04_007415 [Tulasnella sp. 424]
MGRDTHPPANLNFIPQNPTSHGHTSYSSEFSANQSDAELAHAMPTFGPTTSAQSEPNEPSSNVTTQMTASDKRERAASAMPKTLPSSPTFGTEGHAEKNFDRPDPNATGSLTTEIHDPDRFDLLPRVKGLLRLLDLYSEIGSGGLVDKIIISQESLGRFINSVLPGAYTNVTKIDFARLDREASLHLVGIYGSKTEIVRFLRSLGSVDDEVSALLLVEDNVSLNTRLSLRSGIYILSPTPPDDSSSVPPIRYVIYWPEENTWDDNAIGAVRKNRVTFMRYLTCLTDQIHALISPEHEAKLDFGDVDQDDNSDGEWSDGEDANVDDRLFTFEVAKTNEQEEAVDVKAGFTVLHDAFRASTVDIPTSRGSRRQETLIPQFVDGETVQAITTTRFRPGTDSTDEFEESFTRQRFESELRKSGSVVISPSVDAAGFDILLDKGNLKDRDRTAYETYCSTVAKVERRCKEEEQEALEKSNTEIEANQPLLLDQVTKYLVSYICDIYPTFVPADIIPDGALQGKTDTSQTSDPLEYFRNICATYKSADQACQVTLKNSNFASIKFPKFTKLKRRFRIVERILKRSNNLSEAQRLSLVKAVSHDGDFLAAVKGLQSYWTSVTNDFKGNDEKALDEYWKVSELDDARFLRSLSDVEKAEPIFVESAEKLRELALWGIRQKLDASARRMAENMTFAQKAELNDTARALAKSQIEQAEHEATASLRTAILAKLLGKGKQPVLTIYDVKPKSASRRSSSDFILRASCSWRSDPSLKTSVWALELSEDDIQKLKENSSHVPTPRMPRSATELKLPLEWRIRRLQIVGKKKALLIVDCPDKIRLWLFSLRTGFSIGHPQCSIPNIAGRQYVVAVDEQTRLVALAITEPSGDVILQEYLMEEKFSTMRSRGSPLSLNSWYTHGVPEFTHASFFSGTEELCLVEVTGRVRVLMIPSRSFRPAFIQLHSTPLYVKSSPDGTALVIVEGSPTGTKSIRVFHRASFGSNDNGIVKELPESFDPTSNFCITSTGERQKIFLMGFDVQKQRVISAALEISRKETEYQFRAKDETRNAAKEIRTIHNSLIDCLSEVWERFPVAAAIQRQTLSGDGRQRASVTFVSSSASQSFELYFRRMVQDFEKLSRKPTEQRLAQILVSSSSFDKVTGKATSTSQYKAGEWIAELLCLIPIHIAVTSENRFVPLKDGVLDATLEREILGGEVSKIIDAISLGWYESIFSSYMATKPVKVVSSMGEQSVGRLEPDVRLLSLFSKAQIALAGKSYSLNHLVDSSFAGSAVRTTEVSSSLDFEGVHSIERTPQEDMLLVLFNTALSNLVIFRNNFVLSRDVANMFTSFQASTQLFNPATNPRLFKGLLSIVIKDVVDGDKKDIVKEFQSKFSQIVSKEQATNFISVLHDGQLKVIPWSVIQSKGFYVLFSKLKNFLFSQECTHGTAGEFLITLKTLMAKIKAQDWRPLEQTIIKHRVSTLSDMLLAGLEYGRSASTFDADELRNLDDQSLIDHSDSNDTFYVGNDEAEIERTLASLLAAWGPDPARGSVEDVESHLNGLAKSRIVHVKEWMGKNISRFPRDNADIRSLMREFEDLADRLRNVPTTVEHPIFAPPPASTARNTMNPFPACFRLVITEGMSTPADVTLSSIFAARPATSLIVKAAKAIARNRDITRKVSMHARRKYTSAGRSVRTNETGIGEY